jgi:hypothetical protein
MLGTGWCDWILEQFPTFNSNMAVDLLPVENHSSVYAYICSLQVMGVEQRCLLRDATEVNLCVT